MKFSNPPINEIGITLSFGARSFLPDYFIKDLHDLLRDDYPEIERTQPSPGSELITFLGHAPLNADPSISRWWLKSSEGDFIVQVQENFLGLNWRRQTVFDSSAVYPGFDEVLRKFLLLVELVRGWRRSVGFDDLAPAVAEILYDDVIRIPVIDGGAASIAEVLTFWPRQSSPLYGWNVGWLEPFGAMTEQPPLMRFAAMAAGTPVGAEQPEIVPVVRLSFVAMSPITQWLETEDAIRLAHAHIRQRFVDLTTESVRASWGEL